MRKRKKKRRKKKRWLVCQLAKYGRCEEVYNCLNKVRLGHDTGEPNLECLQTVAVDHINLD